MTHIIAMLLSLALLSVSLSAQVETVPGAWRPEHRVWADGLGTALVGAQLGADAWSAWKAKDRPRALKQLACRDGIAIAMSEVLKRAYPEARPDGSDNKSCCSMHTALLVASLGWHVEFTLFSTTFGAYSRAAANKHHWKDIAEGAGIGAFAQAVCR